MKGSTTGDTIKARSEYCVIAVGDQYNEWYNQGKLQLGFIHSRVVIPGPPIG